MLDRYENDDRIGMIQGCNFEERTDDADDADYFLAPTSAFRVGHHGVGW